MTPPLLYSFIQFNPIHLQSKYQYENLINVASVAEMIEGHKKHFCNIFLKESPQEY